MNGHAVDAGRDDYGIDDDRAGSTNLVTVVRRRIDGASCRSCGKAVHAGAYTNEAGHGSPV